ncbi:MAG: sialidase family protein [Candidatus Heimdallarchaeota archaeon]
MVSDPCRKSLSIHILAILLLLTLGQAPVSLFGIPQRVERTHAFSERSNHSSLLGENINKILRFSSNKLVSTDDSVYPEHVEPTLAISDEDDLFVGYKNAEYHKTGGVRVSFVMSTDYGNNWSHPFDMTHFRSYLSSRMSDPWMVWRNGVLHYSYIEWDDNASFTQVTLARSFDKGGSWKLQTASHGSGFADKDMMIVSDDAIYIAYNDVGDQWNEKLSRSLDGGETFEDTANITDVPRDVQAGTYLAIDSQKRIYVAFLIVNSTTRMGDIYLDVSTNGGDSFGAERDVNPEGNHSAFEITNDEYGARPGKISLPVIRFDNDDRLILLWADKSEPEGSWDVYLKFSEDYGLTWSNRTVVNPVTAGNAWMPDMDIDSEGRVHIAWLDEVNSVYRPYYRSVSFSEGDFFSGNREIIAELSPVISIGDQWTSSYFTRPGDYLTLRVDSQNIPHVVWTDGRSGELDIYYSHAILKKEETIQGSDDSSTPGFTLFFLFGAFLAIISMNDRTRKDRFSAAR